MDEYLCCLLGICCAFGTPAQHRKLLAMLMRLPKYTGRKAAADARVRKDLAWAKEYRARWAA